MRRAALLLVTATAALAVALAAPTVRPLAAQEPDTVSAAPGDTVNAAPADTVPLTPPRPEYVPPRYALSVVAGRTGGGTVQEQPIVAVRFDAGGAVADSAILQRVLVADGGFQAGVSAVVSLAPGWAVRLGAGAGRLTLRPRYDGGDSTFTAAASAIADTEASDVSLFFVEGALRMRLFTRRRPQPYLELGASSVRWTADDPPAGAPDLADGVTRFAALAAVGVLIPFNDHLSGRVQVETRAFRAPVEPSPAGASIPATDSLTLTFAAPGAGPFADSAHELFSTTRLDIGLSFGFGAVPRRRAVDVPDPPTAPAPGA